MFKVFDILNVMRGYSWQHVTQQLWEKHSVKFSLSLWCIPITYNIPRMRIRNIGAGFFRRDELSVQPVSCQPWQWHLRLSQRWRHMVWTRPGMQNLNVCLTDDPRQKLVRLMSIHRNRIHRSAVKCNLHGVYITIKDGCHTISSGS